MTTAMPTMIAIDDTNAPTAASQLSHAKIRRRGGVASAVNTPTNAMASKVSV